MPGDLSRFLPKLGDYSRKAIPFAYYFSFYINTMYEDDYVVGILTQFVVTIGCGSECGILYHLLFQHG